MKLKPNQILKTGGVGQNSRDRGMDILGKTNAFKTLPLNSYSTNITSLFGVYHGLS